jgi:hypothetical protein
MTENPENPPFDPIFGTKSEHHDTIDAFTASCRKLIDSGDPADVIKGRLLMVIIPALHYEVSLQPDVQDIFSAVQDAFANAAANLSIIYAQQDKEASAAMLLLRGMNQRTFSYLAHELAKRSKADNAKENAKPSSPLDILQYKD